MKIEEEKNLKKRLPIFCYDIYLKSLFTKYPSILEKFIADVTDIDYELLKGNTELSTNEIPISRKNEKGKRCDFIVAVKGRKHWIINIELNYHYSKTLREKNCAYVSSLFSRSFEKGKNYDNKSRVYQINIDCFNERTNIDKIDECNLRRINNDIFCDNLKIFNINVEKLSKIYYNEIRNTNHTMENYYRWAALFLVKDKEEIPKICENILEELEVGQVMREYDELTKEDLLMTEEEAKRWGEQYADIIYHDGLNDGITKGISKGISQGIEQEKNNNIIAMYNNGASLNFISKVCQKDENYIKSIVG